MKNGYRKTLGFTISILVLFATSASAELVIGQNYQLMNSTRVGRTAYDYTYKVNIINNSFAVYNVKATVTSSAPGTTIIDGDVTFGDVPASGNISSPDTFTIRQNRSYSFDPSSLTWNIEQTNIDLPDDPGEAGKQTLLGIDIDSDGVRDDIQRYIYFSYPDNAKVRAALTQAAIEYQGLLSQSADHDAAFNHATKMARHGECLDYIQGETASDTLAALKAAVLNTKARSLAFIEYSNSLGGEIILGAPVQDWKNSCNFDVDVTGGAQ